MRKYAVHRVEAICRGKEEMRRGTGRQCDEGSQGQFVRADQGGNGGRDGVWRSGRCTASGKGEEMNGKVEQVENGSEKSEDDRTRSASVLDEV